MAAREFNFDGIVGPTHNYSGLSHGNVASTKHQRRTSSPRAAALQGLEKMKFVRDLGIGQCVLPPLLRPNLKFLRKLGFRGNDAQLIDYAYKHDPVLLSVCYSASNMWTANAAMVSPSFDCADRRLHFTPANLASNLHRSIEPDSTTDVLRSIFTDENHFCVHPALHASSALTDEGAANHTRLCSNYPSAGLEVFVYGQHFLDSSKPKPQKYPARQTLESCQAIARMHGLNPDDTIFVQQSPSAIDAGVFHNDVISVGNQNVFLCHESAFVDQDSVIQQMRKQFDTTCGGELTVVQFSNSEISLQDAVSSYLFNSQLVTRADGRMTLVCPTECESTLAAKACTERLLSDDNPVDEVVFLDLHQSMNNGGGPACLRLRVVMDDAQQSAMHAGVILTDALYEQLVAWVEKHYRENLSPDDLRDPQLIDESRTAAESLLGILQLPAGVTD